MFHPQQLEDAHAPFFFLILLICVNDIDCIDYYYLFKKQIGEKNVTLDPRHGTLDPRQKDRLVTKSLSHAQMASFRG